MQSFELKIKKGLFKHTITGNGKKAICINLFPNGWCITTPFGRQTASVRLIGTNLEIESDKVTGGSIIPENQENKSKTPHVKEVELQSDYGEITLMVSQDSDIEILLDDKNVGKISRPDDLLPTCLLPKDFTLNDAAVLYCTAVMAKDFTQ